MKYEYQISGMHCASCVEKVRKSLEGLPGVSSVLVSLSPPRAEIVMSPALSLEVLNGAVKEAGRYTLSEHVAAPFAQDNRENLSAPVELRSLRPLFVIVSYICGGSLLRAILGGDFAFEALMKTFMGGFFVVFSMFKMIDLRGFADGYSTYDLLAQRSRKYALAYPFLELALGIAYLANWAVLVANFLTVLLMSIGSVGVFRALRDKKAIQCACLGTALNLPMTKVTLVEDVAMGAMAVMMILM